jgi:hypothetical protein
MCHLYEHGAVSSYVSCKAQAAGGPRFGAHECHSRTGDSTRRTYRVSSTPPRRVVGGTLSMLRLLAVLTTSTTSYIGCLAPFDSLGKQWIWAMRWPALSCAISSVRRRGSRFVYLLTIKWTSRFQQGTGPCSRVRLTFARSSRTTSTYFVQRTAVHPLGRRVLRETKYTLEASLSAARRIRMILLRLPLTVRWLDRSLFVAN